MSLAQVDSAATYFTTGGASKTQAITVSGTNPLLIVHVTAASIANDHQFPTAVSWSLGGGQSFMRLAQKRNTVDNQLAYASTWVLAAPAAGAGTITVTFNVSLGSNACAVLAEVWSGADQTTPCPATDIVQKDTDETPSGATPPNLAIGNATSAVCAAAPLGGLTTISGNITVFFGDNTLQTGAAYDFDTTGITFTGSGSWHLEHAITAVRIVAAGGTFTLAMGAGSYAVTGTAATPEAGYRPSAAAGSYTLTGTAVTLAQQTFNTWLRVGR